MAGRAIAIVNSSSGAGDGDQELDAFLDELDVERREPGDDLTAAIRAAVADHPPYLAVSGGDGTLRTAATVLADGDVPLLALPGGTFNHFARSLGLEDLDAARSAVSGGEVRTIPLADVDGEVFLNTCVIGWYPDMIRTREELRKRMPRAVAQVLALARHARSSRPFEVVIAGRSHRAWMLWVGAAEFGLDRGRLDDRGREDVVDVRVLLAHSRFPRLGLLVDHARRRLNRSEHLHRLVSTDPVTAGLRAGHVDAALDAEPTVLHPPLAFTPGSRVLPVLVPAGSATDP
ncbi:MAG: diacylglycerol kinase family protein [Acidimicrobiia bacterium]